MKHLDRAMYPPDRDEPEDNGEKLLAWVKNHYEPSDIFDYWQLELWATNAGFILPETNKKDNHEI